MKTNQLLLNNFTEIEYKLTILYNSESLAEATFYSNNQLEYSTTAGFFDIKLNNKNDLSEKEVILKVESPGNYSLEYDVHKETLIFIKNSTTVESKSNLYKF